jgi:hypothetical protein
MFSKNLPPVQPTAPEDLRAAVAVVVAEEDLRAARDVQAPEAITATALALSAARNSLAIVVARGRKGGR